MPYLNGQYYETKKDRDAILSSGNPSKSSSSGSSGGSSSSRGSSSSSSSSGSVSSSSSRGSGSSQGQKLYSDGYGGYTTVDPNSDRYASTYGKNPTRPASGGTSGSSGSSAGVSGGYSSGASRDYHQEAKDAAARGDWSAVTRALAARQEKINAQGGNDRGTSNAQILANLQSQYRDSYDALPSSYRDTLGMAASGQLNGKGWEDGHDYLSEAKAFAQAGDMEAAYDALRRRGFKMADTGSAGGGTSQDQAYALIQGLYDHSAGAASSYQHALEENARRLAEHPTQFGTGTNPSLANKHFLSQDGKYIVYYDSTGTPFRSEPNNGQYGSTKYTPEYKSLMERYYSGSDDYADLRRQLHNLDVVYSGNGRLIDQNWNWASGEGAPVRDSYQYWTDLDNGAGQDRNTGQDKDVLAGILARINGGQSFPSPTQVPSQEQPVWTPAAHDDLSGGGGMPSGSGGSLYGGSGGEMPSGLGGNGLVAGGGNRVSGDIAVDDLSAFIRQMYQQNLEAQLAGLQSSYDQSRASYEAQRDQIAQAYQAQRNQAAAQSDLQRLYMAELGNAQGLNTGATGQLAMAQDMALQNNLASLGASEGQDLAANGLAMSQLLSGYLGNVDAVRAQSGSDLAGALYSEYARQIQAAESARQAAQAQANWEAQFEYQRQQDALAQQNWQTQFDYARQQAAAEYQAQLAQLEAAAGKQDAANAWDLAQMMLQNGVVPDASTLAAAGIAPGDAQSLAGSYLWQLQQKYAPKASSGGGSGGSSGRSSGGGVSKPRLTYSQALNAIENGQATDAAIQAYDYYMGNGAYQQNYGGAAGSAGLGGSSGGSTAAYGDNYSGINQTVRAMRQQNRSDAEILAFLDRQSVSSLSKNGLANILQNYGLA